MTDSLEATESIHSVVLAIFRETHRLGHSCIAPGHVLLGLAGEPGDAAGAVLGRFGLTVDRVRQALIELAQEQWVAGEPPEDATLLPFTRAGKRVLDLAVDRARTLGSKTVRCEHLLLSLTGDDAAREVLLRLGVDPDAVRLAMLRELETDSTPDDAADR